MSAEASDGNRRSRFQTLFVLVVLACVVVLAIFGVGHIVDAIVEKGQRTVDSEEFARSEAMYREVLRSGGVTYAAGETSRFQIVPPCVNKKSHDPSQSELRIALAPGLSDSEIVSALIEDGWFDVREPSDSEASVLERRFPRGIAHLRIGGDGLTVRRADADDCVIR